LKQLGVFSVPHNFSSKKVFLEKSLFFGNAQWWFPPLKKVEHLEAKMFFSQENGFGYESI